MDSVEDWGSEVRLRLVTWFYWAKGNNYTMKGANPLAAHMKDDEMEVDNVPSSGLYVPDYLTLELESVEKAVSRMRDSYPIPRRLLIDKYLNGVFLHDMAADRRWSEEKTKRELGQAESIVGRYMMQIDVELIDSGLYKRARHH